MSAHDVPENQISLSPYAVRRKELLSLVNQLRAIGAQGDLDLPRITVIGKQSAGKSSLVEAISGITVPRDAGTCTRCPMEIRLQASPGPWSCRISIRREYDRAGKRLDEISETIFGGIITDKSDVEDALRLAQLAVLNPQIPPECTSLLRALNVAQERASLKFSRNVVCVDICGPDLTDLSFIDLPGLIQNAEPEDVKLVEDMVLGHIQGNCLILIALPVTDDIENQKALRLAQSVDPNGRRTIGVLTKLDLLSAGSINARTLWLDVIEGRKHSLKHGYYCTRQPDDAERHKGITTAEARAAETEFFQNTEPWASSKQQRRFGTRDLVSALSKLLVQVISESLPRMHAETARILDVCRKELAALPPVIDVEPATYMLTMLTRLCTEFQTYVRGDIDSSLLIRQNREAFADLKAAIKHTCPNFVAQPEAPWKFGKGLKNADDESEGVTNTVPPFYLKDMRRHIEKSVTRELRGNVPFQAKVALITASQVTWEKSVLECFNRIRASLSKILLECVDHVFEQHERVRSCLTSYIQELITENEETCLEFVGAILEIESVPYTQNDHYIDSTTTKWLARYKEARSKPPEPEPSAAIPSQPQQDKWRKFPIPLSKKAVTPESSEPPTDLFSFGAPPPTKSDSFPRPATPVAAPAQPFWNNPATQIPKVNGFALASPGPATLRNEKINEILASLASIGYTGLTEEDLGKLNPVDEYETELHVMAEVRGYFQVSYKRVIDNVPSMIDLKFVRAIGKELQPFLISKFELGTPAGNARCTAYLQEDQDIVAKREELVGRRKRLEKVQIELGNFGV